MAQSTYTIVRETWLTRKLDPAGVSMAVVATLFLLLSSLLYWNNVAGLGSMMPASNEAVFVHKELWRLWTALLAHADFRHLLSNSFLFFIIGTFLAGYFGTFVFPVLALFLGGLINLIVLWGMPAKTNLLGVSGVVFWMGGFWLVMYFCLERRKSLTQRTLRAIGVALVLFMPAEAFNPSVSYSSHFIGFLVGTISAAGYYFWRRIELRSAERLETIIENDDDQMNALV